MPRRKYHRDRIYQVVGEPGPGTQVAGYVRYSSELQDPVTIATQKRKIQEYSDRKGWIITRWYEEPERSAKYEEIEQRPVFTLLLEEAGVDFHIVICYMSDRWARNVPVAFTSLSQLRHRGIWWATADDLWNIDKVQERGYDVAFAIDTQINAGLARDSSKRTIAGKEERALDGYHNGKVPFGYLPPEYPKAPDGAPSTWKPPRMPARIDPINFPALIRLGELAAMGWGDSAIAEELAGHVSTSPRYGSRELTKDTVAFIRRMWFPREFLPGCGHGTIETPSGELLEGRHPAAWPYELWQRMVEAKMGHYRRPQREARRQPREFSRIVVCAGCRRPLRVHPRANATYYQDTSSLRRLPCPAHGCLSVNSELLLQQFGSLLAGMTLPTDWRQTIADDLSKSVLLSENQRLQARRLELEAELKRLVLAFTKGYLSEEDLDAENVRISAELGALTAPALQGAPDDTAEEFITHGEMLADMASYWKDAQPEERRDIVWTLLNLNGLVFDLERRAIVGLIPRAHVVQVLAMGLAPTWEQHENGLWLQDDYLPPKLERENPHAPLPMQFKLDWLQRQQAQEMARSGMTIRQVADHFGVSRMAIWRALQSLNGTDNA
jgi:DNA invertase Pin-like site-specific DNA recombinase